MEIGLSLGLTARRGGVPPSWDFTTGALPAGVTFTRAGSATYFDAAGVQQTALADQPRFDHDPVTLQPRGLLIEESRTNYFTYSGDAASAWTVKSGSTVLSDVETAPDGTVTADAIMESTSTGGHYTERTITLAANQFITYETFVKPKGSYREVWLHLYANGYSDSIRAQFNTVTGTVVGTAVGGTGSGVTASITPFSNGWYRLRLTGQATTAAVTDLKPRIAFINSSTIYTGDGTSGIYVWGAQLEAGSFPTSYIPTTTAAATRAADIAVMTGADFSRWFNPTEGTIVAEFSTIGTGVNSTGGSSFDFIYDLDETAAPTSRINLVSSAAYGPGLRFQSIPGGVMAAALQTPVALGSGSTIKHAGAYKLDNFAASLNGGAVVTDTLGGLPTPNRLSIGSRNGGSGVSGAIHIRRIRYYPIRLDNASLQELTA